MNKIITDNFVVHYKRKRNWGNTIEFQVYPIEHCIDNKNNKFYVFRNKNNHETSKFIEGEVEMYLQGTYTWRGVWEGRLYFTDEEYWGSTLVELSDLYENTIVPTLREVIQNIEGRILKE